jgi:hypothetical protein
MVKAVSSEIAKKQAQQFNLRSLGLCGATVKL